MIEKEKHRMCCFPFAIMKSRDNSKKRLTANLDQAARRPFPSRGQPQLPEVTTDPALSTGRRGWLELRGEAITRIATAVRKAQADGYCPDVDPVMTASALSAMLEHFCYIWLGQGGEKDVPFDDDLALDALCTIWVKAVYWRPEAG